MKKFLSVLLVLFLLLAGGVWYMLRPASLGIAATKENLDSIHAKLGVTFEPLTGSATGKTLILSGSHPVDQTFTSEELTAGVNNRSNHYAYFPFRNVQIRVNADGTVEGSATVSFADAVAYLVALGVSGKDIESGAKEFNIPKTTLPVYLKVSGNITDNSSSIAVAAARISRIPVPQDIIAQYTPQLNELIEDVIDSRKPNYHIERLTVENGRVRFVGTAPDKEQASRSIN